MRSDNLIIWLTGVEYPATDMFDEMIFGKQQKDSQIQSLLAYEMGEIISRSDDFSNFESIPVKHGGANLLLTGDTKKVFIVCCSHYSSSQLLNDLNVYNPDLTIFVRQPKGISRSIVSKFALSIDVPLMLIHIPKVISNAVPKNVAERHSDVIGFVSRLENVFKQSNFLFESPESEARMTKTLNNISAAIFKIAKFTSNLLEAWNRGCRLFDLWPYF